MRIFQFILARGGSKGLPKKNLAQISGNSLVQLSIKVCLKSKIGPVILSSDSEEILLEGKKFKDVIIHNRRSEHATDEASSDDTILGILEDLNLNDSLSDQDWGVLIQPTFPFLLVENLQKLRECISSGIFDSIFSSNLVNDYFIWKQVNGGIKSHTYDHLNRLRRQDIKPWIYENGGFYAFSIGGFLKEKNRLFGRIGHVPMEPWQHLEVDDALDLRICEAIYKEFILEGERK